MFMQLHLQTIITHTNHKKSTVCAGFRTMLFLTMKLLINFKCNFTLEFQNIRLCKINFKPMICSSRNRCNHFGTTAYLPLALKQIKLLKKVALP